jgi:hypothetical protein
MRYLQESCNASFIVRFSEDRVIIRFPKRGITATNLVEEKVRNEVSIMEYLIEATTIPVPKLHS